MIRSVIGEIELKELLTSLSRAIKENRSLFVAAEADPALDVVREHVNALLDELTREAKSEAKKEISSAQLAVNKMEDWCAQETSASDYNAALSAIKKASDNFQNGSYFGYLDALQLAGEAQRRAKKAVNSQKVYMKEVVDKLKDLASKLFGARGDFEIFEVKRYAPDKLDTAKNLRREGQKHSKVQSYASYIQAQSSLKECLKIGYSAIERSIKNLERREIQRWNIAFILLLPFWPLWILSLIYLETLWPLWPLSWILVGISMAIWGMEYSENAVKTNFNPRSLLFALIAPLSFFFILGCGFR